MIHNVIIRFLDAGIWEIKLKELTRAKALGVRVMRTIVFAAQGFIRNDCMKTASVLTYYSLLNVVPLIAVVFAIAKGFGLKRIVQGYVIEVADKANLQPEVTNQILSFANSLLTQTKGGVIAGFGAALLLWTVISILGKIENSFNIAWEVKKSRSLVRQFTDYIAILVVVPILFAISTSATVLVTGQLKGIVDDISLLGSMGHVVMFLLNMLPYLSVWVLLIVLYVVMPNTRVPLGSAILAGVVAGTIFQIVQLIYIKFQIGVSSYGAIYGSFAALPLFLAWLHLSWMIVLFGSEIAHANRHHETFGFHPDYLRIDGASRMVIVLRILHLLVTRFDRGEEPLDADEIAKHLEIPVRFIERLLSELKGLGLVSEVHMESGLGIAFQPARSVESITVTSVYEAYARHGNPLPSGQSTEAQQIAAYLKEISNAIAASPGNVKLKDIGAGGDAQTVVRQPSAEDKPRDVLKKT